MCTVDGYHSLDILLNRHNIERLNITTVIVFNRYDSADLYLVVILTAYRILEIALVNAVSFFRDLTGYTVTKSSESV